MYHKFLDVGQIQADRGYEVEPDFFSVSTVNDLRHILNLRISHQKRIFATGLIDADYFLASRELEECISATSIGGFPICNANWQWPTIRGQPLHYFGRINIADSVDLLPNWLSNWGTMHVIQIFVADFFIGDPKNEVSLHTVNLEQEIFRLGVRDLPEPKLEIPHFPMLRTRIKCNPYIEFDETLEDLATCNVWYPQGTRIPKVDRWDSQVCFDLSGLDLDEHAPKGHARSKEFGIDINTLDSDAISLLQLSGGFVRVRVERKDDDQQIILTADFECD